MTNNSDENNTLTTATETKHNATWQLNALTEALGDLTLSVENTLSIGRGNDNDVVLGSKSVSRNHALLTVSEGQLHLKDLESSNGTFINDERIESNQSKPLNAHDTVSFANFAFQVVAPVEDSSVSAPVVEPETVSPMDTVASADDMGSKDTVVEETASVTAAAIAESEAEAGSGEKVQHPTKAAKTVDTEPVEKKTIVEDTPPSTTSEIESATTSPIKDSISAQSDTLSSQPSEAIKKETVMSNDRPKETSETLQSEPVTDKPVIDDTPVAEEPVTQRQSEPVVPASGGQDKTTTTELQREADPEVLRAKQAATAQFSGTANLGQSRDVGTEGNNAMDQAVNNTANQGQIEKKPSGSWFIWVFVVILIIGIALWLFNMGGA